MDNTVLYCRTANSTVDIQEHQLETLKQYCREMGYTPSASYCDWNMSGATLDRPCMSNLLSNVRAGNVQRIIIKDFSRLARNFLLTHELFCLFNEYGVEVISINDGGAVNL